MKNIRILLPFIFSVLFIFSIVFIINAFAETANTETVKLLSLDQVIEKALQANHKIHISEIDAGMAEEVKKQAVTEFLPKLKTGYGFTYKNDVDQVTLDGRRYYFGTNDNYLWTSSIIQSIFTGLATISKYRIADINLEISEIQKAVTRLDIILEAKKGYFAVQNAKLLVEVGNETVKSLLEHLSVAQEYYEVGLNPKIDVLNASVDLADAKQELEWAKNQVIVTKAALNNILDLPVDTPIEVAGTLKYTPFTIPYGECSEKAINLRPGLKKAKKSIEIAQKQIKLAKSGYYPNVTASMNYYRFGDQYDVDGNGFDDRENWNVMVQADWTFWEWGKTRHAVLQSKGNLRKAVTKLAMVEDRIHFEVKKAFQYLQTAHHNIKVAKTGVEQAKENLEISQDRYKEQVATITEILDAQTRLTQAMTLHTNVLNDYNVAMATLYRAMGME
ncbi:MAG: TolC family protein [Desulfosarcina sp.]|nr:TolC family protein [Desulfobacterales bacterium]